MFTIRPATPEDVTEIVQGWNRVLVHDPIDETRFRDVFLEDPNHQPNDTLVALNGGHIVGFLDCIARDTASGADGRGRPGEEEIAYLRGLYVLPEYEAEPILAPLLQRIEKAMRRRGKRRIQVVRYTGRYIFPGLDLRYPRLHRFLEAHGFHREALIDDMDFDLRQPFPTEYQRRTIQQARAYGAQVMDYEPSMLDDLREFAHRLQMPAWFSEGWEQAYRHMVVAYRQGELIGWANYHFTSDYGSFGPTAVLPEHRGHGIGTWILVETMRRVKERGYDRIWAHWTNAPFYLPNGWRICRQYAFLLKSLDG